MARNIQVSYSSICLNLLWGVNKQLMDEVFVISRIIKVEVGVINWSLRLRLITLTETLIFLEIGKPESNNNNYYNYSFIIHDGKQHKAHKLDMHMITLRHHAPKSYDMITGDVEWLLYNLQIDHVTGTDFENSLYAFSQSEKRWWVQCKLKHNVP